MARLDPTTMLGLGRMLAVAAVAFISSAVVADCDDGLFFRPRERYPVGDFTTGVDAGDLDGDGDVDIVASNRFSGDVSVILNLGDETFAPAVAYAVGPEPRYVVAADLDGDGDLDLATCDRIGDSVTILLNDGHASFSVLDAVALDQATWLTTTDVDLDGDADLLVTLAASPARLVLLANDGSAGFEVAGTWFVGTEPRGGDLADFDGDGILDVAIANVVSNDVSVLLGDGAGGFHPAVSVAAGDGPRYLTAGDLDGDGDADIGVVHKGGDDLWLLRNDGSGHFTASIVDQYPVHGSPHSVTSADLDSDGDLDLIACCVNATVLDVFENDGQGGLVPKPLDAPDGQAHVIAVDVDFDQDLDVVVANKNDWIDLYRNETARPEAPRVIRVRAGAPLGGDGLTWETAFPDLEQALALVDGRAPRPPTEIWVAAGRYAPRVTGNPLDEGGGATFRLPPGIALYGGFAGHECLRTERVIRDPLLESVLCGGSPGGECSTGGADERARHVVTADLAARPPLGPLTVMDGFTVTGGRAGGIDVRMPAEHRLVIRNCEIVGNRSPGVGGGLRVVATGAHAIVEVVDCRIAQNRANDGGGVALGRDAIVELRGCTLDANRADELGGGIRVEESATRLSMQDCVMKGNAASLGGGLFLRGHADRPTVDIRDCRLLDNGADAGGAMFARALTSTVTIVNCELTGNEAIGSFGVGGAVVLIGSSPVFISSVFAGNVASGTLGFGGAVYNDSGTPTITNCTIAANRAAEGGGIYARHGACAVTGCVVWSNAGGEILALQDTAAIVAYSIVEGGWIVSGHDNLDADPRFVNEAEANYRLRADSPAVDSGDNEALPPDAVVDLDGRSRFVDVPGMPDVGNPDGTRPPVDRGAYEFQCVADIDGSGDVGFGDLLAVLAGWGPCAGPPCTADLDGNGVVGFLDLIGVLAAWGACD